MNRKEKEETISEFSKRLEGVKAAVLANYRGLKVEQFNQVRKRMRDEKISFHVVKNTLMRLASKGTDLEKLHDYFEGPTAIALSYGDPIPLAKIITEFQKTVPALEIKIGLADGRVTSPEEVKAMASMPSREVLFAQILGGVQVPGNQLGGAIVNAIQQLLGVLQARVDQLANSSVEGGA